MPISRELIKYIMMYPMYEAKKKNEVDFITFHKKSFWDVLHYINIYPI